MIDDRPPPNAREILSYFVCNPQAADSLEGVATWRVLEQTVQRRLEETAQALEWLVSMGFLSRTSRASTGAIFSLNPERVLDAQRLLAVSDEPRGSDGA